MKRVYHALDAALERDVMTQGFHIFRKHIQNMTYDLDVIANAVEKEKKLECIFNGGSGAPAGAAMGSMGMCPVGDGLRRQLFSNDVRDPQTKKFLAQLQVKLCELIPRRNPNDLVVLQSLPGCAPQQPHRDYDPYLHEQVNDDGVLGGFPLGCLVALEDGTRFNVWPTTILPYPPDAGVVKCTVQVLDKGDILVFRGDLIHSGASFDVKNTRVHAFLDCRGYKRHPNSSYRLPQDGHPEDNIEY